MEWPSLLIRISQVVLIFLGFSSWDDYSLCFYSLMRKGKEINAIVIGHEEVYVIW